MGLSQRDLFKLAVLLAKTVHSVDSEQHKKLNKYCKLLLQLVDNLEGKYKNHTTLKAVRNTATSLPGSKNNLYILARDIIRLAKRPYDFEAAAKEFSRIEPEVIPIQKPRMQKQSLQNPTLRLLDRRQSPSLMPQDRRLQATG